MTGSIDRRLDHLDRRYGATEQRIGPTEAEREFGRVVRRNPTLRKIAAWSDDPIRDLRNLDKGQLDELTEDERELLREVLGSPDNAG
jgi:hypothetical protein